MVVAVKGPLLVGPREQRLQRSIRSRPAKQFGQQKKETSPSDRSRVVSGNRDNQKKGGRSAVLQRCRSPHPAGPIRQSEPRVPSFGNVDPTAAPRIPVIPGRLLQFSKRPRRATANPGVSRGSPRGNDVPYRRAEWAFEIQTEKLCPLPEHLKWQSRRDANVDPAC